jgi:hypothetical protein
MACTRVVVGECGGYIVCNEGLLEEVAGELEGFTSLPVGSVTTRVDDEKDIVYYFYTNEKGAGFYIWAKMTLLAEGVCGPRMREEIVPLVQTALRGDPRIVYITVMMEEKMLR